MSRHHQDISLYCNDTQLADVCFLGFYGFIHPNTGYVKGPFDKYKCPVHEVKYHKKEYISGCNKKNILKLLLGDFFYNHLQNHQHQAVMLIKTTGLVKCSGHPSCVHIFPISESKTGTFLKHFDFHNKDHSLSIFLSNSLHC